MSGARAVGAGLLLAATILVLLAALWHLQASTLKDPAFLSGWLLLIASFLLGLYGLRKRLTTLPLGRMASWRWAPLTLGWLAIGLFLQHAGWRLPDGALEIALWVLYLALTASGIVGLLLSLYLPRHLRAEGKTTVHDRPPLERARIAQDAEALALASAAESADGLLSAFYAERLRPFFAEDPSPMMRLMGDGGAGDRLTREMAAQARYLDDRDRQRLAEMARLATAKAAIDRSAIALFWLRAWLLVHLPATHALLLTALLHAAMAHAFSGGGP